MTDNDIPNDSIDLTEFDDDFAEAQVPFAEEVPDGKYQVRVHAVRLDRSQNGNQMIKWDLTVISGAHAGRHIFKNAVITTASLSYIKDDLVTLGLSLAKFSDLPQNLEPLLDVDLEITKKTRGDYVNVYFNKRITLPSLKDDDDVPF